MTEPFGATPDPELEPMADQFAELDEQALEFELAAEDAVVGSWLQQVATANAVVVSAFAALAATGVLTGTLAAVFKTLVARQLGTLVPEMGYPLALVAGQGMELGYLMSGGQDPGDGLPEVDDPGLIDAVTEIDRTAQAIMDAALAVLDELDRIEQDDVRRLTESTYSSVTRSEATTRWAANRAVARGVERAAAEAGVRLVWVPERNACLHCLAYAGLAIDPGGTWPAGLSMGDKPLKPNPDDAPGVFIPLHPNCRCRPQAYSGPDRTEDMASLDVASVLWREARRSVVRGLTEYASEPARLRAAERLLRRGANLPKTVMARGRRDVKRKRFTDRPV